MRGYLAGSLMNDKKETDMFRLFFFAVSFLRMKKIWKMGSKIDFIMLDSGAFRTKFLGFFMVGVSLPVISQPVPADTEFHKRDKVIALRRNECSGGFRLFRIALASCFIPIDGRRVFLPFHKQAADFTADLRPWRIAKEAAEKCEQGFLTPAKLFQAAAEIHAGADGVFLPTTSFI